MQQIHHPQGYTYYHLQNFEIVPYFLDKSCSHDHASKDIQRKHAEVTTSQYQGIDH